MTQTTCRHKGLPFSRSPFSGTPSISASMTSGTSRTGPEGPLFPDDILPEPPPELGADPPAPPPLLSSLSPPVEPGPCIPADPPLEPGFFGFFFFLGFFLVAALAGAKIALLIRVLPPFSLPLKPINWKPNWARTSWAAKSNGIPRFGFAET